MGNKLVDHSDVVGACPTTSSLSTEQLASLDWAKTTTRRDEKHLSFGMWCPCNRCFTVRHNAYIETRLIYHPAQTDTSAHQLIEENDLRLLLLESSTSSFNVRRGIIMWFHITLTENFTKNHESFYVWSYHLCTPCVDYRVRHIIFLCP